MGTLRSCAAAPRERRAQPASRLLPFSDGTPSVLLPSPPLLLLLLLPLLSLFRPVIPTSLLGLEPFLSSNKVTSESREERGAVFCASGGEGLFFLPNRARNGEVDFLTVSVGAVEEEALLTVLMLVEVIAGECYGVDSEQVG